MSSEKLLIKFSSCSLDATYATVVECNILKCCYKHHCALVGCEVILTPSPQMADVNKELKLTGGEADGWMLY